MFFSLILTYCRMFCGDNGNKNDGGSIVDESGDRPCRDHNNESRNPGDTWLTEDSCNICSCKGQHLQPNPSSV